MAYAGTLHDAFLDELRDAYDAEKQTHQGLTENGEGRELDRSCENAFEAHLEETRGHVDRLEQVFESLDEKVHAASTATASPASSTKAGR